MRILRSATPITLHTRRVRTHSKVSAILLEIIRRFFVWGYHPDGARRPSTFGLAKQSACRRRWDFVRGVLGSTYPVLVRNVSNGTAAPCRVCVIRVQRGAKGKVPASSATSIWNITAADFGPHV